MSEKAQAFFNRAEKSLREISYSRKVLSSDVSPDELERAWKYFLSEFRKVLKFLELSARQKNRHAWADNLISERKGNIVLKYCFHARNAEEHGIVTGYEGQPSALVIGNALSLAGTCKDIRIEDCVEITRAPDGSVSRRTINGNFSVEDGRIASGWLKSEAPVKRETARLRLQPVQDRSVTYFPPEPIVPLDEHPSWIVQQVYNWSAKKVSEAESMMRHNR